MRKLTLPIIGLAALAIAAAWIDTAITPDTPDGKKIALPKETSASTAVKLVPNGLISIMEQLKEPDSEETRYILLSQLDKIPTSEIEVRFTELAQTDPDKQRLNNGELRRVLHLMIDRDPLKAARLCREHFRAGNKRSHAFATIIDAWGRAEPEGALRFIHSLDREESDMNALNATTSFLSEWASRDVRAALAAWLALPVPKLANPAAASYGAECLARSAARTPEMRNAALDMLMAERESDSRTSAIAGVLATWSHGAPLSEAADWLQAQKLDKKERSEIAVITATASALAGNLQAGDWLAKNLSDNKHERANQLATFSEDWARQHPNDCATWLATLEPSHQNDWAISGFLRQVKFSDPESGFHWTRKINDPNLREKSAKELWSNWRRHAPVSAAVFSEELEAREREWLGISE